jgi:hypothetical protein
VMTAIMGPRFSVEADNITMDVNAAIACAQCPAGPKCYLCAQYAATKPRALVKLVWVRAKQLMVWGSLGKLSGELDKLAAMQAADLVMKDIAGVDGQVKVRFEDPGRERPIWGGTSTAVSCRLSVKDVLPSPMLGHAFPILMTENLVPSLPQVLVKAMPRLVCGITDSAAGGLQLPDIKEIADKTRDDCRDLESQMTCAVSASMGRGCASVASEEILNLGAADGRVGIGSEVEPYVSCQVGSPTSPVRLRGSGYSYRSGGNLVTCSFNRDKCADKRLTENTDAYMREKLGLPKVVTNYAASLGGNEPRKPSSDGGSPREFCACTYSKRPVDDTVIHITDAVRKIASFGQAEPSEALRKEREYRSCGKWYFPEKTGPFASVSEDEQPYVGAWKWALVSECKGGPS